MLYNIHIYIYKYNACDLQSVTCPLKPVQHVVRTAITFGYKSGGLRLHPAVHGWARTPHFDQEIVLGPEARWKRSARARSFVVEA